MEEAEEEPQSRDSWVFFFFLVHGGRRGGGRSWGTSRRAFFPRENSPSLSLFGTPPHDCAFAISPITCSVTGKKERAVRKGERVN